MSQLEEKFLGIWNKLQPTIVLEREVKLIPKRQFRFDFCHKLARVAIEINGGTWGKGGHSSGLGLLRDYEKLNLAQSQGYIVFQLAGKMITQEWVSLIAESILSRQNSSS